MNMRSIYELNIYFFNPPPPQKKDLKNIIVYFEYMPERVQLLGLGHKSQLTPIDLCPP